MILLLLFLFWVILNGRWDGDVLITGALVGVAVTLLTYKLFDIRPKDEWLMLRRAPLFVCWVGLVCFEIVKANLGVLRFVYASAKPEPKVITFESPLESKFANFLLSASITLTPGTVTVDLQDRCFTVHCFDGSMAEGISEGNVCRLLKRMEQIGGREGTK